MGTKMGDGDFSTGPGSARSSLIGELSIEDDDTYLPVKRRGERTTLIGFLGKSAAILLELLLFVLVAGILATVITAIVPG